MTLEFDLRGAIDEYEAKTGIRLTYDSLSVATGISVDALKSISSRKKYNVTLKSIELICTFLNVDPIDHMKWYDS